jgi:hypothetical protein
MSVVPPATIRLAGSASSVLRGVDIPAADIDILFADRTGVDAWVDSLGVRCVIETSPRWLPDARQYFARLDIAGVVVELSTVEIHTEHDTHEGFGPGPWRHFDNVEYSGGSVPAVATELRLITEITRGRDDRLLPIIEFLRRSTCDLDLVRRGLNNNGTPTNTVQRVLAQLE